MRSKVFKYLGKLTPVLFQRFDRFVHSPYLSKHAETIRFFELIAPLYPDFESDSLSPEALHAEIYPGLPFEDNRMRTLRKYLFQLYSRFMAIEHLTTRYTKWGIWEADALLEGGETDEFERQWNKAQAQLNQSPLRDADYYYSSYLLRKSSLTFEMGFRSRFEPKSIGDLLGDLHNFYLAEHLKYACTAIYLAKTTSAAPEEMPLLQPALAYCRENLSQLPEIVRMYYRMLCLLMDEPFEEHYHSLKSELLGFSDHLRSEDQVTLFNHLTNYANLRYRRGHVEMLREMLDLYQAMLDRNALQDGGQLSTHHYKNLVTLALRLGDLDWAEQFILNYKKELDPALADGVFNYNMAHLYFYRTEYRKALKLLQQVDFIDPYYRISYNLLMFKIFYECEETEPLFSLILSFRNYLSRQEELSDTQRASYLNFIRFTRALYGVKTGRKHRISHIRTQVTEARALIEKEWLLKKLEELAHIG